MIRFGLVSFAHVHSAGYAASLRIIYENDKDCAKLTAISDPEPARGEPKAQEHGAKFFQDYREMINSGEVDAVIISSENARHVDEVFAAAQAKVHVICEKPIATTQEQIERMRQSVESSQIVFQTAFVCRYIPSVIEAKEIIDGGTYGAIRAISATNHGKYPGGWFADKEQAGGGAIIDHTVHAADVIRMLTRDEFKSITAFKGRNLRPEIAVEDNAIIYARMYKTNIPVSIDCSWSRADKWPTWGDLQISIFCDKGTIKIDGFRPRINVATTNGFYWHSLGEDLNIKLIRAFVAAVNEKMGGRGAAAGTPVTGPSELDPALRAGFEDGARAAMVAISAYKSIDANSQPVVQFN